MAYIIVGAICLAIGIVVGAAIWRNNAKRFEELAKKGQDTLNALKPK